MDDSPHGQSDTPDDILDEVDTKSEAKTGLSESDEENIDGAVGGAINKDGQLDQIKAQNTTQQIYDNDGDSQPTSDEGKVMEGAVGGATVSCDQCETETAIMYCQNCPGHLCKICHDAHKKSKLTRNHSYINISSHLLTASLHVQNEKVLSQEKESKQICCKDHPDKLAKVICKICAHPACSVCSPKHKGHNVVYLHQKHFRQLQSVCLDDSQLLLTLISKLETLQKIASSEGLYNSAIKKIALTKQTFDTLTDIGGNHTLIVESLRKEKREVIGKHNTKLDDIRDTLEEATFVLSKLNFAGTTTDINIVFEALNHFYGRYNTLVTKHANLLAQKYTKPDTMQLEHIRSKMTLLELTFDCYKNPCTRYDRLNQYKSHSFQTVLDFVAISTRKFLLIAELSLIAYYDVESSEIKAETAIKPIAFRLVILRNTRILALTLDKYIVYNENLEMVSSSSRLPGHKTLTRWDSNQILVLTYAGKKCKFFRLNVDQQIHKSTLQFETSDIPDVDEYNNLITSRDTSGDIIIIHQNQSKLYKFNVTGKLLTSVDLPLNSETYISSFYVDEKDNLVVGCSNGEVYFVDYKSNKHKLLLSLGKAVTRIGEIDGLLYVFTCYTRQGEGVSQSTLYVYEIDRSCDHSN